MSTRKALCVGINHFKNYPSATLQGCVNDAHAMAKLFEDLMGFQKGDITTLTDVRATKANIIAALKEMVEGAKAGAYSSLAFSLSSHGTHVPDLSGDEPDRADEAFCPHDLAQIGGHWDTKHLIVDDELRDLFVTLPPSVTLEVYLDTCYSGDGLKGVDMLLDRRPRFLPPPSLKAFEKVANRRSRGLRHGLLEKAVRRHILWAACRSDQTSADAEIGGGWHGAFTHFFCKEMYACKNTLTRKEVLAKVRAGLAGGGYSQIPQLEVEATKRNAKAVFELDAREPAPSRRAVAARAHG